MSFLQLPDAHLDSHPNLTWLVEFTFDVALRTFFQMEEIRPDNYNLPPGTLIISNHQRDSDVPLLTATTCIRDGRKIYWPLPFYAAREDLFYPNFLGNLLKDAGWPSPWAQLLGKVPLNWLFKLSRAKPMRRVREFTLKETLGLLRPLLPETTPTRDILHPRGQREINLTLGYLPEYFGNLLATDLKQSGQRFWGLRRVRRNILKQIHPLYMQEVSTHLEEFRKLLSEGRIIYMAPEGATSENGHFGTVRGGVRSLCLSISSPPNIMPIALAYDVLGFSRPRVVIQIGNLLDCPEPTDAILFNIFLRNSLLRLHCVTASHLIARFLRHGPTEFTDQEFCCWMVQSIESLQAADLSIDPLLTRIPIQKLVAKRLRWLQKRKLVKEVPPRWRNQWPKDHPPGWLKPAAIVAYLDNALSDICALEPTLTNQLYP